MEWLRRTIISVFIAAAAVSLSACGDTWHGFKEDTGENLQKSGGALEGAGEDLQH